MFVGFGGILQPPTLPPFNPMPGMSADNPKVAWGFQIAQLPRVVQEILKYVSIATVVQLIVQWNLWCKTTHWTIQSNLIWQVVFHQRYKLGLCTGTWFIVIPVNRHRYQNRYGHSYSFDIHFDMFLTRYTKKMQEIYVFCGELCWKRVDM